MSTKKHETLDAANARVLADLVMDSQTTEHTRLHIINKLLEARSNLDFFDTLITEKLDFGCCPDCGHENWWLTPEDELNKRGLVTAHRDPSVKDFTTKADCEVYEEACKKKKTSA